VARIISSVIIEHPDLSGVWQVSSNPIDKYSLLQLVRDAYQLDIDIQPSASAKIDRSLDSSRFRAKTGFVPPPWPAMIEEMAQDPTPYDQWRKSK
jgi:dTDP-4-dehydrorhamnose reductase